MSYNSELQAIQIYSSLFNSSILKDDKYWTVFLESNFHYVSLNATFKHMRNDQVQGNLTLLNDLFKQCLKRLTNANAINVLQVFIKNVCAKDYGTKKNDILLKIFGGINELNENFVRLLKQMRMNLNQKDDFLKFSSFKLFAACVKGFYNTLIFEIFYQVDLNDEIYNLFLIKNLDFEIIGEIFVTLSILNCNSLVPSNFYKLQLSEVFGKEQILSNINYQLRQFLIFGTLFYHELKPDLLVKKEQNSSFYNWITFNRYNTKVNDYKSLLLNNCKGEHLNHYLDVKLVRFQKRKELLKELVPVYMFLFALVLNNEQYGGLLTTRTEEEEEDEIGLLEVFLSLTSFILQYQNSYNNLISRLGLLIINHLVSRNAENLSEYYIDQYRVKMCYQRQPIIDQVGEIEYLTNSAGVTNEMIKHKNSLYYILDVIQCQIRFNLSKKLDLISYKLASFIILKVLNSINYEQGYNWHDFFKSLFLTLNFLIKNFDKSDEKISSLIEEILIIVEITLVNFYNFETKNPELVEMIYKILESSEQLLILKSYNKGNLPNLTILLNLLVTKFSTKMDLNYNEIYQDLTKFIDTDEEFKIIDYELYQKVMKQDVEFEHKETFKYLRMNSINSNNKISMVNKCIEEMENDDRLFY